MNHDMLRSPTIVFGVPYGDRYDATGTVEEEGDTTQSSLEAAGARADEIGGPLIRLPRDHGVAGVRPQAGDVLRSALS